MVRLVPRLFTARAKGFFSGLSAMGMNLLEPGGWSRRTAGLHFNALQLCYTSFS